MRFGNKRAAQWLQPLRVALRDIRATGEVLAADGHPMMVMPNGIVRIDWCVIGVALMIERLLPDADTRPLHRLKEAIEADEPLTPALIDAALGALNRVEKPLARLDVRRVESAAITEEIAIEMEQLAA